MADMETRGWMPIETAPRDGTVILIAGGADDQMAYQSGRYDEFMQAPTRAMWSGGGWLIALAEACCVGIERINPTHWMPLPTPPEDTGHDKA